MTLRYLITGPTGFIGRHLVEAVLQRGGEVVAMSRTAKAPAHLERDGVTWVQADMTDAAALTRAVEGVDVVLHTASQQGEYGRVEGYRAVNVEGVQKLLDACANRRMKRIVHFSCQTVHAARHHEGTTENEPLPASYFDGLTQSKAEGERVVLEMGRSRHLPVVVLRPGLVYGPGNSSLLPQIVGHIERGTMRYIGGGRGALNTMFIDNLIPAVFQAVEYDHVNGQIYHLTDGEFVTKRQFIEAIADGLSLKRPNRSTPLWVAKVLTSVLETRALRKGRTQTPRLTQSRLKLLGYNLDFSIAKARMQLGFHPTTSFADGMRQTLEWYRAERGADVAGGI